MREKDLKPDRLQHTLAVSTVYVVVEVVLVAGVGEVRA